MGISQRQQTYIAAFDPHEYLYDYGYGTPDAEGLFTIRFMITALQTMPAGFLALEFGGGPILYSAATLAAKAREIHFCDYLAANLKEIQKWLADEADAFDWRPYIKAVLAAEDSPINEAAIDRRVADIRQKVSRLMRCDALAQAPLGETGELYDLVVAHHCTDVAAESVAEWMRIMQNISALVAPGGWLLISVTTGTTCNTVGPTVFACVDLTDDDIFQGYLSAGYDADTFRLDKIAVAEEQEYTGCVSAIARKLLD